MNAIEQIRAIRIADICLQCDKCGHVFPYHGYKKDAICPRCGHKESES